MNEFSEARIKLTLQYMAVSAVLLVLFTSAAISAERRAFNRIEQALTKGGQRPAISAFLETRIREFSRDYMQRLFTLDAVLLVLSAGASWFLSGKTLKPIEEMMKKQEEFSQDASHELRTPLTTMAMEIEALKRTDRTMPEKYRNAFASISEEIDRMKFLTDGLLTLVRAGESASVPTSLSLPDIAGRAVAKVRPLADDKKLSLTFAKKEEVTVRGREESLLRLLIILLDNAVKYTPSGTVMLTVGKLGTHAFVKVSDTGIGIPDKDLPHVFDRFYRVRSSLHKGTGLGLSIAKKIVTDHGGKITAESRTGRGSVFTVTLPLHS